MGKKRVITKTEDGEIKAGVSTGTVAKKRGAGTARKKFPDAKIYIHSSYNNTLISLTDATGNLVTQVSAGGIGFKGTRKSTPYAASKVADALTEVAQDRGVQRVDIVIKGIGAGRDSALRALGAKGFDIQSITDATPVPHNGPRAKKPRRL